MLRWFRRKSLKKEEQAEVLVPSRKYMPVQGARSPEWKNDRYCNRAKNLRLFLLQNEKWKLWEEPPLQAFFENRMKEARSRQHAWQDVPLRYIVMAAAEKMKAPSFIKFKNARDFVRLLDKHKDILVYHNLLPYLIELSELEHMSFNTEDDDILDAYKAHHRYLKAQRDVRKGRLGEISFILIADKNGELSLTASLDATQKKYIQDRKRRRNFLLGLEGYEDADSLNP